MELVFIEPYTDRLMGLLGEGDHQQVEILEQPLQAVDPSLFSTLQSGDILFIDSTHVSKAGSDVNLLFFEIIPRLHPGVYVHVHDVFYPFEYPERWIMAGRAWNENYLLRSFLQFNTSFEVTLFPHMMHLRHAQWMEEHLPITRKQRGGSFWMRRTN